MRVFLGLWIFLGVLYFVFPPVCRADEKKEDTETLGEVVTVGERESEEVEEIKRSSGFVTQIQTKDVTERVDSVSELLGESVGVQVQQFGGLGGYSVATIRGSSPNQVTYYIDGIPVNQANFGVVNLENLPLSNVERIEVYRGFSPSQFGQSGIGGVINFVTRAPEKGTRINSSASYGSFDTDREDLLFGKSGSKWSGQVFLERFASEGDYEFDDDNGTPFNLLDDERVNRKNNDFEKYSWMAKGGYQGSAWQVGLLGDFFVNEKGVPGLGNFQSEDARLTERRGLTNLNVKNRHLLNESGEFGANAFFVVNNSHFEDTEGDIGVGNQDQKTESHVYGLNTNLKYYWTGAAQVPNLFLQVQREDFEEENLLQHRKEPDRHRNSFTAALDDEVVLLNERLFLLPGVRYEYYESEFEKEQATLFIPNPERVKDHFDFWSPRIGWRLKPNSFFTLKSNFGRYFRVPDLTELFGDRGVIVGNPELEPEHGVNFDVGFELHGSDAGPFRRPFFEAAFFSNRSRNLITFEQNSQRTSIARNVGKARIQGLETSFSFGLTDYLFFSGNYTFQDTVNKGDRKFHLNKKLPFRPEHEAHIQSEFTWKWIKLTHEVDWIDRNFLDQANVREVHSRTIQNAGVTASFLNRKLKTTFEIKNLSDRQVEDFIGYPLPGRSYFGTVSFDFDH